jgi:RNA polymerase sigma-70 factor, ECF subfamily
MDGDEMEWGPVALEATEGDTREHAIALLHQHGPLLLAAARAITLDDDEAADLVQATFEIALRKLDQLREPEALPSWLLRIETREAFRVVRRLRRLVRFDPGRDDRPAPAPDLAQHADIRSALSGLPPRIRAAVALHHLAGLPVADTARVLGVSENTIKSQLKAGLARLREALGDD